VVTVFTGLITELGQVAAIDLGDTGARIGIAAPGIAAEITEGDSVAVNGACLTAAEVSAQGFAADVMNQTLSLTALGALQPEARVNLELAMPADGRFGGHIVAGHVDGVGEVTSVVEDGIATRLTVRFPEDLLPLVVERGSVALSGVSLTVASLEGDRVEVSLIPETLERTNLGLLREGDSINLECDLVARHVRRLLESVQP
jgi:riboflavin synthase